ncbi:MAG: hypothetical protein HQL51_10670 [Magnetococcales bacterium]|nr:hypothetical protein [Magnetococcales bacterium]
MLRAYMVFSGTGPILVVTRLSTGMQSRHAQEHLAGKGLEKYIAFEVPVARAKERYGPRFQTAVDRLNAPEDIRVVDLDGHHVFSNFQFNEMGEPVFVGPGDD